MSTTPIEGGVVKIDISLPDNHPDRVLYRSPTNKEYADQAAWHKASVEQQASADRAYLRLERNRLLRDSDWIELPSAADRLTPEQITAATAYRQQLRDLVIDDLPELPTPPDFLVDSR